MRLLCLMKMLKTKNSKEKPVLSAFQQVEKAMTSNIQAFRNGMREQEHHSGEVAVSEQHMASQPGYITAGKDQQEASRGKNAAGGFIC